MPGLNLSNIIFLFGSPGRFTSQHLQTNAHGPIHHCEPLAGEAPGRNSLAPMLPHFLVINNINNIIVTGLESHTKCASRARVVRLYMPKALINNNNCMGTR
jgi:hypothetical protein